MKKVKAFLQGLLGKIIRGFIRLCLWIAFRPKVTYVSDAAREALKQPCVLISNHVRGFDCPVLMTAFPTLSIWNIMARDMVEGSKALQLFLPYFNTITVDRSGSSMSMSWLRDATACIKGGNTVFIAPEGYCHFDRVIREFKPGFAMLAAMAGVKAVPVYNDAEYHILFGRRCRILVGEPLEITPAPAGMREKRLLEESAEAFEAVQSLEKQLTGSNRHE